MGIRKLVKQQLEDCAFADLSKFVPEANAYFIPKYSKPSYEIGKCYIITVADHIVNNHTSTTAVNWNQGGAPKYKNLKIFVSKTLGKNIYVDSIGYNLETNQEIIDVWSGWLNIDEISQISKL